MEVKPDEVAAEIYKFVSGAYSSMYTGDSSTLAWSAALLHDFPNLADLFQALLSTVPSEASCERSFSQQGSIHTEQRAMLSAEQVEAQTIVRFSETSHRERKRKIRGDEEVYLLCNETRLSEEVSKKN